MTKTQQRGLEIKKAIEARKAARQAMLKGSTASKNMRTLLWLAGIK